MTEAVGNSGEGTGTTVQVVIQQPAGTEDLGRYPRYTYLVFSIGFFLWHFIGMITFLSLTFANTPYGGLWFFCGLVPAVIAWVWVIIDATVHCANPGTGMILKVCCCDCVNMYALFIPVVAAAVLRFILWCALFGIVTDILLDYDADVAVDNFFWLFLSLGTFDVGPYILLAIDWYWYYGKLDFDALFGNKVHPLRCIVGQCIILMIISWAFVAVFEEYADDLAEFIWPWIMNGLVSTAIIVFALVIHSQEMIKGATVTNIVTRYVAMILGAALAVLALIIWGFLFDWMFQSGALFYAFVLFAVGLYYTSMVAPTIWCLFTLQVAQ